MSMQREDILKERGENNTNTSIINQTQSRSIPSPNSAMRIARQKLRDQHKELDRLGADAAALAEGKTEGKDKDRDRDRDRDKDGDEENKEKVERHEESKVHKHKQAQSDFTLYTTEVNFSDDTGSSTTTHTRASAMRGKLAESESVAVSLDEGVSEQPEQQHVHVDQHNDHYHTHKDKTEKNKEKIKALVASIREAVDSEGGYNSTGTEGRKAEPSSTGIGIGKKSSISTSIGGTVGSTLMSLHDQDLPKGSGYVRA